MIATLLLSTLLAGGLTSSVSAVDKVQVTTTATVGSGISLTGAGGQTLVDRSPAYISAEVGVSHPRMPWLEISPGLLLEVEGRVGVGFNPKVRAFLPLRIRILSAYGLAAAPMYFAPYSLVGGQVGVGFGLRFHRLLSLVVEGTATGYFWGSDLIDGGALGKLDVAAGLKVHF